MLTIRDGNGAGPLYRATHATFEAYCEEKWSLSRPRAYQLIDAARLSTMVDIRNERQARELAPLLDQPDTLRRVAAEVRAAHGDRTTAADYQQPRGSPLANSPAYELGCLYPTFTPMRTFEGMAILPNFGTMIRCVGPSFEAGSVAYSGRSTIRLPRRTSTGHIIPDTFAVYRLKQIGEEWVYELVEGQ